MTIKEILILITLALIQFTNIVDFMIMVPMGDVLKKSLHLSPSQFGWLLSSYGLAAGVTSFLGVFYLDNVGRKKILLIAYSGFILGTLSSAVIPNTNSYTLNYILFIGTRIFTGISSGLLGSLVMSIVADIFAIERRGKAIAVVSFAFSAASVIGVPLALILLDISNLNWHLPFYMVTIFGVPTFFMAFYILPTSQQHLDTNFKKLHPLDTIRYAFSTTLPRYALVFSTFLILGQFIVFSCLPVYLINNIHLLQKEIKYIYLLGGLSTIISGMLIGKLVDKIGRFKVFYYCAVLSLFFIFIYTNLVEVPLFMVLVLSSGLFVVMVGRMIAAETIVSGVVTIKNRGGFMSLNSAAKSMAMGIGAALGGSIIHQKDLHSPLENYNYVGYVAILFTCCAIFMVSRISKVTHKQ